MKEKIDGIIDKNEPLIHNNKKCNAKSPKCILIMSISILAFFVCTFLQKITETPFVSGILAQFQVMISVFFVVRFYKTGFIVSLIINLLQSLSIIIICIIFQYIVAIPGVVVPLFTVITCFIIYVKDKKQHSYIEMINSQRQDLTALSEEISSAYEEMKATNETLLEKNRIIENNEENLRFIAFNDILTGLPNRAMVVKNLDIMIEEYAKQRMNFSLVVINIDNFKRLNDAFGHQYGDSVLIAIAKRLQSSVNEKDIVAHLSGDEFVIIITRQISDNEIISYIDFIRSDIKDNMEIIGISSVIGFTAGIAVFPRDAQETDEILKCAALAEHHAKDTGKNVSYFYKPSLKENMLRRTNFEIRLKTALKSNEFFLVYQPQYFTENKNLRGFETLVRWREPELGIISPIQFIPLAEEIGIIVELGEWIIRTACLKLKEIKTEYNDDFVLSINISAIQLMQRDFIEKVNAILKETNIDGKYLEFEITESVFISDVETVAEILKQIHGLGIQIALDDFGTGYSSLNYLYKLPIDTLKIDKSFIDQILNDPDKKHIVGSIISLAHDMQMSIIAEGVEVENQLKYLKNKNCDIIQGYIWGRPLSDIQMREILKPKLLV